MSNQNEREVIQMAVAVRGFLPFFCDMICNKWFRKARIGKCVNQNKNHPVFAKGLYLCTTEGIVGLAFLASVLNNKKTLT